VRGVKGEHGGEALAREMTATPFIANPPPRHSSP
jgi:hypothetical protein